MFKSYVQGLCSSPVFDVKQFRLNFRSTALFLCLASVQRIDQVKIVYVYFSQRCPLHVHWCAQLQGCCPCSLACLRTGQPSEPSSEDLAGPFLSLSRPNFTNVSDFTELCQRSSRLLRFPQLHQRLRQPPCGVHDQVLRQKFTNGLGE